jgi:uncharacterized protein (TIGR02284 family)
MYTNEQTPDTLNSLLRDELAATETYQQAMAKWGSEPGSAELRRLHDEHSDSANRLRQHVHAEGGQPQQDSGAWGAWAKTVEGTAKLFGNTAALKALKEGEEHGIKDYERALGDHNLPLESRSLIRSTLLPRCRAHLPILDRLMQSN